VNAKGTVVVGNSSRRPLPGQLPPLQAFRWTAASGMVGLGFCCGGARSDAFGVNADGTVVVGHVTLATSTSPLEAFRWVNGTMTGLGFLPGGSSSSAAGVNADGTVVVGESGFQAFRWVNGTMTGLGFLPGGNQSSAQGVNADGTVVVGQASGQAFRWTAARGMVGLDFLPGGTFSRARGVNADGTVVVGQAIDASGQSQAFRWTAATRMQSVLTLLQAAGVVTMAGWQLRSANGVSADGTVITGDGVDPLGLSQAWIARLPEESNEDCKEDDRS
jgi:probable HAF family extracellular repeat protein